MRISSHDFCHNLIISFHSIINWFVNIAGSEYLWEILNRWKRDIFSFSSRVASRSLFLWHHRLIASSCDNTCARMYISDAWLRGRGQVLTDERQHLRVLLLFSRAGSRRTFVLFTLPLIDDMCPPPTRTCPHGECRQIKSPDTHLSSRRQPPTAIIAGTHSDDKKSLRTAEAQRQGYICIYYNVVHMAKSTGERKK